MKNITFVVLCLILVGCANQNVPPTIAGGVGSTKPNETVQIDASLLAPCDKLDQIVDNPTPLQVLEQHNKDVAVLKKCSNTLVGLQVVVRKAFNLTQP